MYFVQDKPGVVAVTLSRDNSAQVNLSFEATIRCPVCHHDRVMTHSSDFEAGECGNLDAIIRWQFALYASYPGHCPQCGTKSILPDGERKKLADDLSGRFSQSWLEQELRRVGSVSNQRP